MNKCFTMVLSLALILVCSFMLTGCGTASGIGNSITSAESVSEAQSQIGTAPDAAGGVSAAQETGSAQSAGQTETQRTESSSDTDVPDAPVADASEVLTTEQAAEYAQTAYNDLASTIMLAIQDGWQSVTPESLGISDIYAIYPENRFGFLIQDINNDGIPELLLGETVDSDASSPIYDIFTADETGALLHVFTGGERNRCFLYENGSLENLASSGAADSSFIHYVLEDGMLVADDSGESGGNYVDLAFQYFSAS